MRSPGEDGLEKEIVIENGISSVLITEERRKRDRIGARFAENPDNEGKIFGSEAVPAISSNHRVFCPSSDRARESRSYSICHELSQFWIEWESFCAV